MYTFFWYASIVLFFVISLALTGLVLIQKGRGGGLSNAFGGGAGGHTAFGSKTGDVLTWATSILFAIFVGLAIALNLMAKADHEADNRKNETVTPSGAPAGGTPLPPSSRPARPELPPLSLPPLDTRPATPGDVGPATLPSTAPVR